MSVTVTELQARGIRLRADGAELVIKCSPELMTRDLIRELRTRKAALLAELEPTRRVFEYRLAESPDRWKVVIAAPGEDQAEVERTLKLRFGAERVLGVRAYAPGRAGA